MTGQDLRCTVHYEWLMLSDLGCGVEGWGFRVWGFGFRVYGFWFGFKGLGFRECRTNQHASRGGGPSRDFVGSFNSGDIPPISICQLRRSFASTQGDAQFTSHTNVERDGNVEGFQDLEAAGLLLRTGSYEGGAGHLLSGMGAETTTEETNVRGRVSEDRHGSSPQGVTCSARRFLTPGAIDMRVLLRRV